LKKVNEYHCDKCKREIVAGQGMRIITDEEDELFFCKMCIKEGFNRLQMKDNKTVDEVSLLNKFRRYLKSEQN
jgi:hypothetical protein